MELMEVQDIIRKYEAASEQRINLDKTEITLSSNVPDEKYEELYILAGIRNTTHTHKYLGLPMIIRRS